MTDRARQCYALLRTLLAWTPAPPASRTGVVLAQQQRGFVSEHRYQTCPDCLANGRPEGMRGCETCGGRGELADVGKDSFDAPPRLSDEQKRDPRRMAAGHGGVAREVMRDRERQRDDELRRLEQQLAKPEKRVDEQADDVLSRAVAKRDRAYRAGSYAELEQALSRLRDENLAAYHVAMTVAYQPFQVEPVEPVRRVVVAVCELLALWMPEEVRVPAGVSVYSRDEEERMAREARAALQWGHSDWASASRAERKRAIVLMHGEGLSDGKIAARFGLSRSAVQKIRAGILGVLDENGHEEAA